MLVKGPRDKSCGYGRFKIGHWVKILAHRFAWMLRHGAIDDGVKILHRCDNPPCVNPDHLFAGSQRDNILDCYAKGRLRPGGFVPRKDRILEVENHC